MPKTEKGCLQALLGGFGGAYISDTNAHTPETGYNFVRIHTIESTVITLVGNITGITTKTFPANFKIYVEYSSITLGSGSVIAYQG